jgi:putative sigma-54 modulation protein
MNIYITARHFKAHETLRAYAFDSLNKLEKYYDGILSADLILSFEKSKNSVKAAELIVKVQGAVLKSLGKTDDYVKSIDEAVAKIEKQIQKYKSKHGQKNKIVIRKTREKI